MTDDDLQIFITLKFGTIGKASAAFADAVKSPPDFIDWHGLARSCPVIAGVRKWAEQGCPAEMIIDDKDVGLFLEIKFGSLQAAHRWWHRTPPGANHGLTAAEVRAVLDYVDTNPNDTI